MNPLVPLSWGELIDKVTILEIKSERLTAEAALKNVRQELAVLRPFSDEASRSTGVADLKAELKRTNEALWQIEDDIRAKEAAKTFDADFVRLARAVYFTNDERGRIKRKINEALNSGLTEEKQYSAY